MKPNMESRRHTCLQRLYRLTGTEWSRESADNLNLAISQNRMKNPRSLSNLVRGRIQKKIAQGPEGVGIGSPDVGSESNRVISNTLFLTQVPAALQQPTLIYIVSGSLFYITVTLDYRSCSK